MDPYTEKLLERTRARRENLQKKLSERPAAAGGGRPMAKRPREPLGEANSVTVQAAADAVLAVPQASTKPSPSKRKCSGENLQPAAGEENQEPPPVRPAAPRLSDPPTDKKPPAGPSGGRHSSTRAAAPPEPEKAVPSAPEVQEEEAAPPAALMRSRLQRLAEQRRCWDGDASAEAAADCPPLSVLSRPAEVPVAPPASSEAPVGRRGRLAHLAATIGSWEDDLSHANIPKESPKVEQKTSRWRVPAKEKTPAPLHPPPSSTLTSASSSSPLKTPTSLHPSPSSTLTSASSSSPLKAPASLHPPPSSPLKAPASLHPPPSSPLKAPASLHSSPSSPLKSQAPSTGPYTTCSPHKAEVRPQAPHQEKPPSGAPAVKSFLERFEERCQERALHPPPQARTPAGGPAQARTPAGGPAQARTPTGGPAQTRTPAGTPNTRLVQDRLRAAQNANTSTADLTQRQKLERESELALIRNRFQKGNNIWRNNDQQLQSKASSDQQLGPSESSRATQEQNEEPAESEETTSASQDEPETQTPPKTASGPALTSPPVSTSSPLRCSEEEGPDEGQVASRDQTINSAVISQLFEGVLDQTEEEEEDALNISSMSLLTPLAAVVKSPERGMMTSTPANSFLLKNTAPDHMTRPSRIHKPIAVDSSSSDSLETGEDEPRLPYSIDAYRSTRVKETERPGIKQVIVRKEDVSQRAGEPRGAGLFNVKQKMKVLSGEVNLQQTVIHQASQALNCCTDEEHGKGSPVEAEAERLLLVATERREALKSELERLRGKPAAPPDPPATSASRGSVSLQELRLPLKADFVCSAAGRSESKHSFFILIRAGAEHTVATPLASTHCGLSGDTLAFNTTFTLSDASSDFEIDVEVYCLVQKRELCTDKKKKTSKSKAITPKRFLAISRAAQAPVVASPGGPHAVRTSNFVLVGSHKLTLSSIGKSKFPLEKVPFLCPLEGHVFLKLQCEVGSKVEERGFLTMFEDVSGFGAWHRRWCVLSGYCISYWTYPDDERRKNPIGRINLASCTSRAVEPANREFCARPNTMELITARPQREDDKETLVSQCADNLCVTTNWLSADTKEERNLWMKKLNQILTDLRMWRPDACFRPQ